MNLAALEMQSLAEQLVAAAPLLAEAIQSVPVPLACECSPSRRPEERLAEAVPVLLEEDHRPGRSRELAALELKAQVLT